MKILLINIDSRIPNLALHKIELYHKCNGDEVYWDIPLFVTTNKIYVSCVFTANKERCREYEGRALIGGSGYDIMVRLPPEIEKMKPKLNWGFTTRGCIRNCEFCVVPKMEGKIRIVGDIYDFWDGEAKELTIMDNNILALPTHFRLICGQIRKEKLKADFNQGLDARLLTDDIINELKTIRHDDLKFAWDNMNDEEKVKDAIVLLQRVGINRCTWYVLVGFNTSWQEDMYRLQTLKTLNQNVFVMRHEKCKGERFYNELASWGNRRRGFQALTFEEYVSIRTKNRIKYDTKANKKLDKI